MSRKVILDLGAHKGEDSDYYLKKGFKVLAVEASEKLYRHISEKFSDAIAENRYKVFNYAVTEKDNEQITFYQNTGYTEWGTIFNNWDLRNKKFGTDSVKTTVNTIRLDSLLERELQEDEILEYIKIDIEGADVLALRSLSNLKEKPRFISLESDKISWDGLLEEFAVLKQLGYTKFKISDQSMVQDQECPYPAKEGNYIDHKFNFGSSGLFGDELPGEWLTEKEAIKAYKSIFVRYKYFGDSGILNNRLIMKNRILDKLMSLFKLKYPHVGWHDTHACL